MMVGEHCPIHVKAAGYTAFEDAETAKDILLEEIEKRL